MRMKVRVNGDRRLTEKVILEVREAARRLGLEIANVEVRQETSTGPKKSTVRRTTTGPKSRKPASNRKPRAHL
jgi:hypothetical protein